MNGIVCTRRRRSRSCTRASLGRTFSPATPTLMRKLAGRRKLARRRLVTPEMINALRRIASERQLQRCDVVGGEEMGKTEWADLRADQWELPLHNPGLARDGAARATCPRVAHRWRPSSCSGAGRGSRAASCGSTSRGPTRASEAIKEVKSSARHRDPNDRRSAKVEAAMAAGGCNGCIS